MSSSHPLTRLVARYGSKHGMYLFGEYCLIGALGFEAFRRRHTEAQLQALAMQLAPLSLWPADHAPPRPQRGAGDELLEQVARSLSSVPLQLGLGIDLFRACCTWASSQGAAHADLGAWFEPSRSTLASQLGFMPPGLRVLPDDHLATHAYRIYVWGEVAAEGEAFLGQDLMRGPGDEAPPALPYPWTRDPAGPGWVTWLPIGPGATPPPHLERLHWIAAVNRHLMAVVPKVADKLLSVPVVHDLLEQAEAGGYDHELERYVSVPELRLVFQTLVRQGLRLEPAPMLEAMLKAVIADLGGRNLAPNELERIARQLPVFSTPRLVGVVRQAMGLGAQPVTPMSWPGGPAPEHAVGPVVPGAIAERWRELAAQARQTRPEAAFWVHTMRAIMPLSWQNTGYGLRWSLQVPREPGGFSVPSDLAAALHASGRMGTIQLAVERHLDLTARIEEIVAWLADPNGRKLSAPAAAMAASPSWPDYAWVLATPGRLLDELCIRSWAESQGLTRARTAPEGI